jgi:hypothetical protein
MSVGMVPPYFQFDTMRTVQMGNSMSNVATLQAKLKFPDRLHLVRNPQYFIGLRPDRDEMANGFVSTVTLSDQIAREDRARPAVAVTA